jgi:hypothetical protein
MDQILEGIPFLQGRFDHGPCKEEDGYVEPLAGKNLIRRLNLTSLVENVGVFDTYFTEEAPSSKRKSNQIAVDPVPNVLPSKVGKTMGGRKTRRTRFRQKRLGYKKSRRNIK